MPSLLSADFANLQSAIESVPSADAMHVDVMDNHFVPNLTLGLPVVEAIRKVTRQMLDIHLMIEQPDRWAPAYAEAGAESVTFHVEAAGAPVRLARELHRLGARAAMALKPATPIEPYADLLPELDMVLIMTVEPGFGGQKFLDLCLPKIARTRAAAGPGRRRHLAADRRRRLGRDHRALRRGRRRLLRRRLLGLRRRRPGRDGHRAPPPRRHCPWSPADLQFRTLRSICALHSGYFRRTARKSNAAFGNCRGGERRRRIRAPSASDQPD